MKFVPRDPFDNKAALVWVMVWRPIGQKLIQSRGFETSQDVVVRRPSAHISCAYGMMATGTKASTNLKVDIHSKLFLNGRVIAMYSIKGNV